MNEYIDPVVALQHIGRVREERVQAQRAARLAHEAGNAGSRAEATEAPVVVTRRWVPRGFRAIVGASR